MPKATTDSNGGTERLPDPLETLNFKVTSAFKKAFKGYAVEQGMTMIELLKEGFELCKEARKSL